jgi:hypothetical protein
MISRCTEDSLGLHTLKDISNLSCECTSCHRIFPRKPIHGNMYLCGSCGKKSHDLKKMTDHLRNHKKEKNMDRYKLNSEFRSGVSVKMIEDAGACEDELHKFAFLAMQWTYNYEHKISFTRLINFASKCNGGIDFLVSKGFIEANETYGIGCFFKDKHEPEEIFILAAVGEARHRVTLINIQRGTRMNIADVHDFEKITESEFAHMTGQDSGRYELIKIIRIKYQLNELDLTKEL